MVAKRDGKDIGNIEEGRTSSGVKRRAIVSSPWFCLFAAQGPVRQRSISADLIFWFFCIKTKEQNLRGY